MLDTTLDHGPALRSAGQLHLFDRTSSRLQRAQMLLDNREGLAMPRREPERLLSDQGTCQAFHHGDDHGRGAEQFTRLTALQRPGHQRRLKRTNVLRAVAYWKGGDEFMDSQIVRTSRIRGCGRNDLAHRQGIIRRYRALKTAMKLFPAQSYRSLARKTPAGRTSRFLHRYRPVFPLQPPQNPIDNHIDFPVAAGNSERRFEAQ